MEYGTAKAAITPFGTMYRDYLYLNVFINLDKLLHIKIYKTKCKKNEKTSRHIFSLWVDCFYGSDCIISGMIYYIAEEKYIFATTPNYEPNLREHLVNIINYIAPKEMKEADYLDRPLYFDFVMNNYKALTVDYVSKLQDENTTLLIDDDFNLELQYSKKND